MFAYCASNPVSRKDESGLIYATLITIGVSAVVSVGFSALSALASGEEFTAGDAVGAAVAGAAGAMMTILGVPPIIANPVAAFCGGIIGQYVDKDYSKDTFMEVVQDTAQTAATTAILGGAGRAASKLINSYTGGKYQKLTEVGKFLKNLVYKPKYLNTSSVKVIVTDSIRESASSFIVERLLY